MQKWVPRFGYVPGLIWFIRRLYYAVLSACESYGQVIKPVERSAIRRIGFNYGLDVDDWGQIDRFQSIHPEQVARFGNHAHSVQPYRIRPIGRAGCENADERISSVITRVNLQYTAIRLMQPSQNP